MQADTICSIPNAMYLLLWYSYMAVILSIHLFINWARDRSWFGSISKFLSITGTGLHIREKSLLHPFQQAGQLSLTLSLSLLYAAMSDSSGTQLDQDICDMVCLALWVEDFKALKEIIFKFMHSNGLRDLFLSPASDTLIGGFITLYSSLHVESWKSAIQRLFEACFSHVSPSDRKTLSHLSNHWFNLLKSDSIHSSVQDTVSQNELYKSLKPQY